MSMQSPTARSSQPRCRVFVSSVMDGFAAEREAARRGIQAAGAEPVLADDFPSMPVSSRTACLDAVASCDACLVIIGSRGGWTTPSGRPVVEEEYEEAKRRSLPVVVLVGDVERDDDADRLAKRVSDYVDGRFRRTYSGPEEIEGLARDAVRPLVAEWKMPMSDSDVIQRRLDQRPSGHQGPRVHVVMGPERKDQLVSPLKLGEDTFVRRLYAIGHQPGVGLLSYEGSMSSSVDSRTDELTIRQSPPRGARTQDVVVRITPGGLIDVEALVARDSDVAAATGAAYTSGLVILEGDVIRVLQASLSFAQATYDELDPYGRFGRLRVNAALAGHGSRPLMKDPPTGGSVTMSMHAPDPIVAYSEPQPTTRQALRNQTELAAEVIGLFARRLRNP